MDVHEPDDDSSDCGMDATRHRHTSMISSHFYEDLREVYFGAPDKKSARAFQDDGLILPRSSHNASRGKSYLKLWPTFPWHEILEISRIHGFSTAKT